MFEHFRHNEIYEKRAKTYSCCFIPIQVSMVGDNAGNAEAKGSVVSMPLGRLLFIWHSQIPLDFTI